MVGSQRKRVCFVHWNYLDTKQFLKIPKERKHHLENETLGKEQEKGGRGCV